MGQKKFAKDTFLIFTLRIIQFVLQFATTYFIVRAISKEAYGEYNFILSVIGILAIFSLPGVNNATMQATARGFPGTYLKAVPVSFFASFAASVVLVILSGYFYLQESMELATGFIIAAPLFPFYHGLRQWRSLHAGQENFKDHFIYNSFSVLVMAACMIMATILHHGTLLAPLLFLLLIPVLQNIWITIVSLRRIPKNSPIEEGTVKYGVHTSFYSSISIIANHIDKILLFSLMSPVALAVFAVSQRAADFFQNFNQDLAVVLAPKFAKQRYYTKKMDRYIKLFVFMYSIIVVFCAFVLLPALILFLFGEEYASSIGYAQALLCSVCLGNMATIRFRFIRSKLDRESHRKVILITSFIKIVSAVILIWWLGVLGAVITVYVHKLSLMIIVSIVIKKHRSPDWEEGKSFLSRF